MGGLVCVCVRVCVHTVNNTGEGRGYVRFWVEYSPAALPHWVVVVVVAAILGVRCNTGCCLVMSVAAAATTLPGHQHGHGHHANTNDNVRST